MNGGTVMNAVVSVIGKDRVGILARVSTECANANANVLEVTQTLLRYVRDDDAGGYRSHQHGAERICYAYGASRKGNGSGDPCDA